MASAGVNVPAGAGGDGVGNPTAASASPPECRMPRRRSLEPQGSGEAAAPSWVRHLRPATSRFSPSHGSADKQPAGDVEEQQQQEEADPEVQEMELVPIPPAGLQTQPQLAVAQPAEAEASNAAAAAQVWPMAFGYLSVSGRLRVMEDTISLHPNLCTWAPDGSPMHFFAVFDGHGGPHVSALCRERMHQFLVEDLGKEGAAYLRRRQEWLASSGGASTSTSAAAAAAVTRGPWPEKAEEERAWRSALTRTFRRVDAMSLLACACGRVTRPSCRCHLSVAAAGGGGNNNGAGDADDAAANAARGIVGSTAVVALLVRGRLIVANVGDSRALLCRGPTTTPVPLSFDHKPNRPDERARIEAAGGRVLYNNGYRVRGILAMSRAIGDRLLRPEVIAVPEITITDRTEEDECLILASDGMWDVMNNDMARNVALQCLEDGNPFPIDPAAAGGAPAAVGRQAVPRCNRAAALLGRLAMGRETLDNISIIVVDLKHRE